ncbi:hypothetical protein [Paraburkholderia saeva]|uniref:Uncharacterized protein n=1 Tax=Paraburkholderia saeva TaxID=2777537 RepID=A0A9N8X3Y1_9BURK|nr:hypothetical protein [Paraburkholderia saeva]CAG4919333.1 hypothetical protein LMG31841_04867 [Paraburkholderia saeva]
MGRLTGATLFAAGFFAGIAVGWFVKYPPTDSASAASWVQALGSLAAIGIAVWVPLRERRATEKRLADERAARSRQQAEQVRTLAADTAILIHNSIARAPENWNKGGVGAEVEPFSDLSQRVVAVEQNEFNKHRLAILFGMRALLTEVRELVRQHDRQGPRWNAESKRLDVQLEQNSDRWRQIANNLNDEAISALRAVESGASD